MDWRMIAIGCGVTSAGTSLLSVALAYAVFAPEFTSLRNGMAGVEHALTVRGEWIDRVNEKLQVEPPVDKFTKPVAMDR